jgi:hypothetical protein
VNFTLGAALMTPEQCAARQSQEREKSNATTTKRI